jgi:hypothetical protein
VIDSKVKVVKDELDNAWLQTEARINRKLDLKVRELNDSLGQLGARSDEHTAAIQTLEEQARARNGTVFPPLDWKRRVALLKEDECFRAKVEVVVEGKQMPYVIKITRRGTNDKKESLFQVEGLANQVNWVKESSLHALIMSSGGKDDGSGMRYLNADFADDTLAPEDDASLLQPAASGDLPLIGRVPAPEMTAATSGDVAAVASDSQPAVEANVAQAVSSPAAAVEPVTIDPEQANMAALVATAMPDVVVPTAQLDRSAASVGTASFTSVGRATSVVRAGEPRTKLSGTH